jgi:uncharacterized protein
MISEITKPPVGPWISTQSGRFYPLNPRPDDVNIEDIATALSNVCRFAGHVVDFYSVAQHSVVVSSLLASRGPRFQLFGLLHDAAEAYLGDMASPVKRHALFNVGSGEGVFTFDQIERKVMSVIYQGLNIRPPTVDESELVKLADKQAFAMEVKNVLRVNTSNWDCRPVQLDRDEPLQCVGPKEARRMFLFSYRKRMNDLTWEA